MLTYSQAVLKRDSPLGIMTCRWLTTKSSNPPGSQGFFLFAAKIEEERAMVLIRVHYDAYNRQFKLIDGELAHALEDGETYLLIADLSSEDLSLTVGVPIPSAVEDVMA